MGDNISRTKSAILAINKSPNGTSHGPSKNRIPPPGTRKVSFFAKGGPVKMSGGGNPEPKKTVREMLKDPERSKKIEDIVFGFSGATGAPRLAQAARKAIAAREAGYAAKNAEMASAKPSVSSRVRDKIADFKQYISDVGRPSDYRDSTAVKAGRKVVENSGKAAGTAGALAGTGLAATTMKSAPRAKEPDYVIDIAEEAYSPKDDDINIKATRSSETLKSAPPARATKKAAESGEDAVARYNRTHGGDDETQAKIKEDFASGAAKYAKGGKAKSGGIKHGKEIKNVLKQINAQLPAIAAAKAARPVGIVAPPMGGGMPPGMKKGGKPRHLAAGGAAKVRKHSPTPNKIKMVNYPKGG